MFKSINCACVKPSSFSSIYCFGGIRNYFLRIILYNFLILEKNISVPLFFVWMKVGVPQSNQFTFLKVPLVYRSVQLLSCRMIHVCWKIDSIKKYSIKNGRAIEREGDYLGRKRETGTYLRWQSFYKDGHRPT